MQTLVRSVSPLGLALAVFLIMPTAALGQLGGGEEQDEEEMRVPVGFRVGAHAGVFLGLKVNVGTGLVSQDPGRAAFGMDLAVDPKVWPVMIVSSGYLSNSHQDLGENYFLNINLATDFGLSGQPVSPYLGAGIGYLKYIQPYYYEELLNSYSYKDIDTNAYTIIAGLHASLGRFKPFIQLDSYIRTSSPEGKKSYSLRGGIYFSF